MTNKKKQFLVIGGGYVGLPLAALLSKNSIVTLFDTDVSKIKSFKNKNFSSTEILLNQMLYDNFNNLNFVNNLNEVKASFDLVFIALPTNLDEVTGQFNTQSITETLNKLLKIQPIITIIIRSTVPIGFTNELQIKYPKVNFLFMPEFLREGFALEDSLNPSRIVIGGKKSIAIQISKTFNKFTLNNPASIYMTTSEAEAVKLFANSFLAMRISFFNELDTFCLIKGLSPSSIIKGISLDRRIGDFYNNPSFGFGGYCLPKDTKQLIHESRQFNLDAFKLSTRSNMKRKKFIFKKIIEISQGGLIGIYRLSMKAHSDNFRESALLDILDLLKTSDQKVIIFEPLISVKSFKGFQVENNINRFLKISKVIVANRFDPELEPYKSKLFTRDIFFRD